MSSPAEVKAKLELDREKKLADYFIKTFYYLTLFGGSYGFFHTKRWTVLTTAWYIVMYSVVSSASLLLLYASYLVSDRTALFCQCFHVFLITLVVLTPSITLNAKRKELKEMIELAMNSHALSECSSVGYLEVLGKRTKRKMNRLLAVWTVLYSLCAAVCILNPLINSYGDELELMDSPGIYWKNLPIPLWWPLDAHNTMIGYITLLLYQMISAFTCTAMGTSAIITGFLLFETIMEQLKLLTHSIENIDQRAYIMFKARYPGMSTKRMDSEYEECFYKCIVENAKHYQKIKLKFALIMKLASIPLAVPFFGGAMLLALAGITLQADDDPRLGPKLLFGSLAITEAVNMLLLCQYGETFQELTAGAFYALFYTSWYKRSIKFRRSLIILRCATFNPLKVTAGKLIVLNMETFSNLVNSAYSIFNLSTVTSKK